MAKVNLSVPDELKAQMDALDLNWSKVARDAFEHAINVEKLKENSMDMEAGIARLRVSKQQNDEREQAEGVVKGKRWAIEDANYEDLERVAKLRECWDAYSWEAKTALWRELEECRSSFEDALKERDPSEAACEGFIEGAGEIFDEV